jgi:hypothetical protein
MDACAADVAAGAAWIAGHGAQKHWSPAQQAAQRSLTLVSRYVNVCEGMYTSCRITLEALLDTHMDRLLM